MGQARELMDRLTEAVMSKNLDGLEEIYSPDVVITTPDQGALRGQAEAKAWHQGFVDAFPDLGFEYDAKLEAGDTAIDQGTAVATHTGTMETPDGQKIPPTGKQVRMRACDVATIQDGRIVRHDFYFDQMEMMSQLGLLEQVAPTSRTT